LKAIALRRLLDGVTMQAGVRCPSRIINIEELTRE
jgi:hypothetical protein